MVEEEEIALLSESIATNVMAATALPLLAVKVVVEVVEERTHAAHRCHQWPQPMACTHQPSLAAAWCGHVLLLARVTASTIPRSGQQTRPVEEAEAS